MVAFKRALLQYSGPRFGFYGFGARVEGLRVFSAGVGHILLGMHKSLVFFLKPKPTLNAKLLCPLRPKQAKKHKLPDDLVEVTLRGVCWERG